MIRCQSFVPQLWLFVSLVATAHPVPAGQIPLTPESVIGGSGACCDQPWDTGPFAASLVADNQWAFEIDEPDQNPGDANGGYWLGKEGDQEEFFVLDLGQEYLVEAVDLFPTHNATLGDRSTNAYEVYGGTAVAPLDNPAEPQAGGLDLADPELLGSGNLSRQVIADDPIEPERLDLPSPYACVRYLRLNTVGPPHDGQTIPQQGVGLNEIKVFDYQALLPALQPGDADMDLDHDQLDNVLVLQGGKYLTGEPATWGEGDWNGAPGGSPGSPPPGDGIFDQLDIIAALSNAYLTGKYASLTDGASRTQNAETPSPCGPRGAFRVAPLAPDPIVPHGVEGDGQTSLVYDASTGELAVDAPASTELTSINIDSAAEILSGNPARNLGGSFDNDSDDNIFKATFGSSFGSLTFGNVAQTGLSQSFLLNDLAVAGSLAGGGPLGKVDLVYQCVSSFGQELAGSDFTGRGLTGECFSHANLQGAQFQAANLTDAYFAGTDLTNATLTQANLWGASFRDATLSQADLTGAVVTAADFTNTTGQGFTDQQFYSTASYQAKGLRGIRLSENDLSGWDFAGQDLTAAALARATLTGTDLSHAELGRASFAGATLTGASFRAANLTEADFSAATLTGADLSDAVVKGAGFADTTNKGFARQQLYATASYQAKDLEGIGLSRNDLSGWDFARQNLTEALFGSAMLAGANFADATLIRADLQNATLRSTNLSGASMAEADFTGANLAGADLRGAVVKRANFARTTKGGFTRAQLYSTASYQGRDLEGIGLSQNDLSRWNLAGQNLARAQFRDATLANADLSEADLRRANFSNATLTLADLRGANLAEARFDNAILTSADLSGADLRRARFQSANLTDANFRSSNLSDANLSKATLTGADLSGAMVTGADFTDTTSSGFTQEQFYSTASYQARDLERIGLSGNNLTDWDFSGQNLREARFSDADLEGADLSGAVLEGARLGRATLTGADLTGAVVKRAQFGWTSGFTDEQLYSTASYQAKDLEGIRLGQLNLSGWDFAGQDLTGASFGGARLRGTDLTGAVVKGASFGSATGFTDEQLYSTASYQAKDLEGISLGQLNLSGWDLTGQNLRGAECSRANFRDADLRGADLAGAYLWGATFTRSDLSGANLAGVRTWDANLSFADLRDANLAGAYLRNANLSLADLRGARGVDLNHLETRNTILPDGSIVDLVLRTRDRLMVRDHELPINVTRSMSLPGTLELRFEDASWGSVIHIGRGVKPNLGGTLTLNISADAEIDTMRGVVFPVFRWNGQPPLRKFDRIASQPGVQWDTRHLYGTGTVRLVDVAPLMPGDATRDFMFDTKDLVRVLQAGKYMTGEPTTWGEGDWNGGSGGWWGSPPAGDGVFDQLDIVAALAGGKYLAGPTFALKADGRQGDGRTSVVYNPKTGALAIDAPEGEPLSSINIDSVASIFTGDPAVNLGGKFDNGTEQNIFKATFGSSFGSLSFGNVARPGLSEAFVANDLTVIGSLAGGGQLADVDLIYVPEPSGLVLAAMGLAGLLALSRWGRKGDALFLLAALALLPTKAVRSEMSSFSFTYPERLRMGFDDSIGRSGGAKDWGHAGDRAVAFGAILQNAWPDL